VEDKLALANQAHKKEFAEVQTKLDTAQQEVVDFKVSLQGAQTAAAVELNQAHKKELAEVQTKLDTAQQEVVDFKASQQEAQTAVAAELNQMHEEKLAEVQAAAKLEASLQGAQTAAEAKLHQVHEEKLAKVQTALGTAHQEIVDLKASLQEAQTAATRAKQAADKEIGSLPSSFHLSHFTSHFVLPPYSPTGAVRNYGTAD
jgi:hypothetical protein